MLYLVTVLLMLLAVGVFGFFLMGQMKELRTIVESLPEVIPTKIPNLTSSTSNEDHEAVMSQLQSMAQSNDSRVVNAELLNVLSVQDRLQLTRLVALMQVLDGKMDHAAAAAAIVADDLAASVGRANATDGPSGSAADAALRNL